MEIRPRVVLLGESLLMDGVAEGLARCDGMVIVRMDSTRMDLQSQVKTLSPDIIVFELGVSWSYSILSLISEMPGTLLLGLDIERNRVIVLNSHEHMPRTMKELHSVLQEEAALVLLSP